MVMERVIYVFKHRFDLETNCNKIHKNNEHHLTNLHLCGLFYKVKAVSNFTLKTMFHTHKHTHTHTHTHTQKNASKNYSISKKKGFSSSSNKTLIGSF